MAKESKVSIGVTITGDGETATYVPRGSPATNAAAPNGGTVDFALAAGNNVITPPTGSTGVVIDPPTSSTNVKMLKGVAGDTGIQIKANAPSYLALAGVTVFSIDSVAIETVALHWT